MLARIVTILMVTAGVHALVIALRASSRRLLQTRAASESKVRTLTGFVTSTAVFVLYFLAVGLVLRELGISITAYLASASIVGLAVSFGSQGLVQDVITGLTLVFSDLLDVGDLVDVGGQMGIVEHVGIRFTELVTFSGARVAIPNRTITSVVSYPRGYVRAFLDVRLPSDADRAEAAEEAVRRLAQATYERLRGILLVAPSFEGRVRTSTDDAYLRVQFRVWPGQGNILETTLRPAVIQTLKELDPGYADWMVTVHHRAEPADPAPARRLPRPAALERRSARVDEPRSGG